MIKKKQLMQLAAEEKRMLGVTFQPHVADPPFPMSNFVPIEQRYQDVQKHKQQMLQNLREKFAAEQNLTFAPQINPATERIAEKKFGGMDVIQRIREHAKEIERKKENLVIIEEHKIAQECTFQPNTDSDANDHVVKFLT